MKRGFALIVLLLLAACTKEEMPRPQPMHVPQIEIVPPVSILPEKPMYEPPPSGPNVVEIKIEARTYEFLPNEIKVKRGDFVKLIITATDVTHTFTLPAYGIDVPLPLGQDIIVEFIADKAGTFSFSCMMPGHSDKGMTGKLIVT